jgi:uncharacterized caspase-like protein
MRKALVVGINAYQQCPLTGCINDANSVAQILERNGDDSINFAVRKVLDINSKGTLRGYIEECFAGDADVALFYFSGHGYIDAVGGNIVTPDYSAHDMGVSMQEIVTIVNTSKCKSKVVVLDCCHSGFLGHINTEGQTASIICEGVTLLTASKSDEAAMEIAGHGVFTSLFLAALSGGAADVTGHITPGGIYAYIDKALGPWDQRPVFKTNVTRFSPLRKVVPQLSEAILRQIIVYFDKPDTELRLDPSFEPTNTPTVDHEVIKPYADKDNVKVFSDLQKLEGVGLVVPCEEEHMYFAAMKSRSCKLTSAGQHFWRLVREHII